MVRRDDDYSARFVDTVERSVRVGATVTNRWASRSLEDGEWTVDTVTADVIADWEEITPLVGQWLDLWLDAIQQAMNGARPDER